MVGLSLAGLKASGWVSAGVDVAFLGESSNSKGNFPADHGADDT